MESEETAAGSDVSSRSSVLSSPNFSALVSRPSFSIWPAAPPGGAVSGTASGVPQRMHGALSARTSRRVSGHKKNACAGSDANALVKLGAAGRAAWPQHNERTVLACASSTGRCAAPLHDQSPRPWLDPPAAPGRHSGAA
jgi:hypothetical protein